MTKRDKILDDRFHAMSRDRQVEWLLSSEGENYLESEVELYLSGDCPCDCIDNKRLDKVYYRLVDNIKRRKRFSRATKWRVAMIAASLIPLLTLSTLLLVYLNNSSYSQISVANGDRATFTLSDGTRVALNSGTTLRYPNSFGIFSRMVELDGQAYFDVKASKLRPFTINASGAEVVVTGTHFDVEAYKEQETVTVSLDEGVVSFNYDDRYLTLQPNQQLVFDRNSKNVVVEDVAEPQFSVWIDDVITAENMSLEQLLFKLSKKFDVEFEVVDTALYDNSYTLTLNNLTIEQILHKISKLSPVSFRKKGDLIIVNRSK